MNWTTMGGAVETTGACRLRDASVGSRWHFFEHRGEYQIPRRRSLQPACLLLYGKQADEKAVDQRSSSSKKAKRDERT
jgi:hypothetical protein